MKLVSPVLRHVVYPGLALAGYFRRHAREIPAVVTYHGVFPDKYSPRDGHLDGNLVTIESFRRQLDLLRTHYNIIRPEDFLGWCKSPQPLPPRSVLLTCDDGLRNVFTVMLPELQEQGLSCLFLVTGASLNPEPSMLWYEELFLMLLDGPETVSMEFPTIGMRENITGKERKRALWWRLVKRFSEVDSEKRKALIDQVRVQVGLLDRWNSAYLEDVVLRERFSLMGLPELRVLVKEGMTIGAHTMSHPMLSQQSPETACAEIGECRSALEAALGCNIRAMAYPFGGPASAGAREFEMSERAGFECAFLNVENGTSDKPLFAFPRIHVNAKMSLSEFDAHVSGSIRSFFNSVDRVEDTVRVS